MMLEKYCPKCQKAYLIMIEAKFLDRDLKKTTSSIELTTVEGVINCSCGHTFNPDLKKNDVRSKGARAKYLLDRVEKTAFR